MTLLTELTDLVTELDNNNGYPYHLPENLFIRFHRFRKAMQLVASTINDRKGRAFLRKYETGERGEQLDRLQPNMQLERPLLLLMLEFSQDADQMERYLKQSKKRPNGFLN
uniref:Uncharacterized protein n=1 Tax=Roseihalotalea indica TaxID=2867963 RepID=A0AA49GT16_9BACT|nr:hypothetical protein K4G66_04570 [Tunicatimonas sp. TK19036]